MCEALCKIHCTAEGMKWQLKGKNKVFLFLIFRGMSLYFDLVAVTAAQEIFLLSRW